MSAATSAPEHHKILMAGGGTAGITVAARLMQAGKCDLAIVGPSRRHSYQPLFPLVGGAGRRGYDGYTSCPLVTARNRMLHGRIY